MQRASAVPWTSAGCIASKHETGIPQNGLQRSLLQNGSELPYGRAFKTCLWYDEIVVLVLHGDEAQPILARDAVDGHAPIGPALGNRRRHGIVRLGLGPVAGWAGAVQQAIDQNTRPAAGITTHHETVSLGERRCHGRLKRPSLEPAIAIAEHDALEPAIAGKQVKIRG